MEISKKNKYILTVTIILCALYSYPLGLNRNERLSAGFILLFIPVVTLYVLTMENTKTKKIILSILLALGVLFIIAAIYLLIISGRFDQVDDRFNLLVCLTFSAVFSPILISYGVLCKTLYKEII
ncbi:hypothetical protein JCM1393_07640 [Clostridium carnis]